MQLCSPGATGFCITCSVSYDSCREDKISESNYCRPQGGQGSSSSPLLRPARALFPGAETSLTSSFFIAPFLLDGQDLSVCSRCSPLHPIQGQQGLSQTALYFSNQAWAQIGPSPPWGLLCLHTLSTPGSSPPVPLEVVCTLSKLLLLGYQLHTQANSPSWVCCACSREAAANLGPFGFPVACHLTIALQSFSRNR